MPNLGSGSLLVKIWQCYNGAQSVSEVTLALGSASVVQALGQVGLNLVQWLGLRAFTAEAKV